MGLGEEEAKILASLYLMGASKASSIAKSAGLPRICVYRELKKLQEKNVVESSLGRPVRFSAVPVDTAMQNLITSTSDRLKVMQGVKEEIIQELSKFKAPSEPLVEAKYRMIEGRAQIYSALIKMIGSARSEIIFFTVKDDLMRMYYAGVSDALEEARKRGIKILGITEIDHSSIEMIENYSKYVDIHHMKIPGMSIFFVIDDSEVLQSAMTKDIEGFGEGNVALWTNAKNFVMGIKGLLEESWDNAIGAETRISALKSGGSTFQDIIILRGWKNVSSFYANMLSNAKSQVSFISVPYDVKFFDVAIQKSIAQFNHKNVKLNVLTSITPDVIERLKRIGNFADVRHIELPAGMNVLLIDEREVLILPSATHARLTAIWSNVREYVEHYKTIFSNLWDGSSEISCRMVLIEQQVQLEKLGKKMQQSLKDLGYEMKGSIVGISGLTHDFHIIASHSNTKETTVIDINGSKRKEAVLVSLVNFVAKCIDLEVKDKLFITMLTSDEVEELASAYGNSVNIVNKDGAEKFLETIDRGKISGEYYSRRI
ncbi:MAG: helix-turn-helix domain-containing protein [Nitrososphaerales archaeon]